MPLAQTLSGVRVLVVEDNYLVAGAIAQNLRSRGAAVLGPAPTVDRALELVEENQIDAALLDIDLQGSTATPVALRLRALGRPFVFLTGYGSEGMLPDELADQPRLTKPLPMEELAAAVLAMVNGSPGPARPV